MLTQNQAGEIFDRIKKLSSADEVEVLFSGANLALTRFANNTIHQNVADENHVVSVRTVFAGRTARATTNKFDNDSLRRVVASSEALAKVQHPDPDLLPMPDSREADAGAASSSTATQLPSRYFAHTAAITPQLRADGVKKIVSVAKKHKLTTAGIFSSSESVEGIFNSRGLSRWHTQTLADSVTMLAADSSGWQKANSPDVTNLDPLHLAEIAAKKAIDSAKPAEIPAGKYTVILEPSAVLDLVGFMFWDYSGMAILDQRSFLTGRIGSKLFGDNITIWDDVTHPLQSGSPFDPICRSLGDSSIGAPRPAGTLPVPATNAAPDAVRSSSGICARDAVAPTARRRHRAPVRRHAGETSAADPPSGRCWPDALPAPGSWWPAWRGSRRWSSAGSSWSARTMSIATTFGCAARQQFERLGQHGRGSRPRPPWR